MATRVKYEIFKGTLASWDMLFQEAAAFATRVGRDRLISISHSEDQNAGVVTVWYWDDVGPQPGGHAVSLSDIEREIEEIQQ